MLFSRTALKNTCVTKLLSSPIHTNALCFTVNFFVVQKA